VDGGAGKCLGPVRMCDHQPLRAREVICAAEVRRRDSSGRNKLADVDDALALVGSEVRVPAGV